MYGSRWCQTAHILVGIEKNRGPLMVIFCALCGTPLVSLGGLSPGRAAKSPRKNLKFDAPLRQNPLLVGMLHLAHLGSPCPPVSTRIGCALRPVRITCTISGLRRRTSATAFSRKHLIPDRIVDLVQHHQVPTPLKGSPQADSAHASSTIFRSSGSVSAPPTFTNPLPHLLDNKVFSPITSEESSSP